MQESNTCMKMLVGDAFGSFGLVFCHLADFLTPGSSSSGLRARSCSQYVGRRVPISECASAVLEDIRVGPVIAMICCRMTGMFHSEGASFALPESGAPCLTRDIPVPSSGRVHGLPCSTSRSASSAAPFISNHHKHHHHLTRSTSPTSARRALFHIHCHCHRRRYRLNLDSATARPLPPAANRGCTRDTRPKHHH